ncbi:MAG: gamma-glutamylcyclotransferase [Acidobacteriia bacterium]|nr:gamma-glutamylcyclotransferase [Terriglobia bacterium]MBV8902664.1 gamma-glutamylcyclotransferase [Terriglobia bacterium]
MLLFVYGTLRRFHERHSLLNGVAEFTSEGTVQGCLYDLGRYPGLALSASTSDRVIGEVYRLLAPHEDDTLCKLDEYEGIGPGNLHSGEYRRKLIPVLLPDGSVVEAWAYVLNRVRPDCRRILSGDYHAYLRPGLQSPLR